MTEDEDPGLRLLPEWRVGHGRRFKRALSSRLICHPWRLDSRVQAGMTALPRRQLKTLDSGCCRSGGGGARLTRHPRCVLSGGCGRGGRGDLGRDGGGGCCRSGGWSTAGDSNVASSSWPNCRPWRLDSRVPRSGAGAGQAGMTAPGIFRPSPALRAGNRDARPHLPPAFCSSPRTARVARLA